MKKVLTLADAGRLGGKARAKALTAEQRQQIARNAINARWDRVRANGTADERTTPLEVVDQPDSKTKKAKKLASNQDAIGVLKCAEDVC